MRIGLLHDYELRGSGSNEFTRYLSRALARRGHEIQVLCREPDPAGVPHARAAWRWERDGTHRLLFEREGSGEGDCVLQVLPHASVRPVYVKDKARPGRVKAYHELTDAELKEVERTAAAAVRAVLARFPVDVLLANHLVGPPTAARLAGAPFAIYPHGSSLEYTLRRDRRLRVRARAALAAARALVAGSREMLARIVELFPDLEAGLRRKSAVVGVGVDTALFRPVERARRRERLAALRGPFGGKTPEQRAELRARLDRADFGAVEDPGGTYDHGAPDRDLAEQLASVPFETGPVLLYVGALTAGKGLQGLIAAFPAVLERHPRAHLLLAGSGAYREVLEALVHAVATGNERLFEHLRAQGFGLEPGGARVPWEDVRGPLRPCPALAERIRFLGRLDHDLLRHLFPCADLAVFPSVVPEAYPLVLLEACANGVPAAVSDLGGFREAMEELEPVLGAELVRRRLLPVEPERRAAELGPRLAELLAAPELAQAGPGLRALAESRFDWDVRAAEFERVLQS